MITPAVIHPGLTVPIGFVALIALLWYCQRVWRTPMSAGRRRVRFGSITCLIMADITLVAVLSFVSHQTHPFLWASLWLGILALMVLVILLAFLDALKNWTWYEEEKLRVWDEMMHATRKDLRERSNLSCPDVSGNEETNSTPESAS